MEADLEGDFRDASGRVEEFAHRPANAAARDVIGQGKPGQFLEDAAKVGIREPCLSRHSGEREGFVEMGVHEMPGLHNRFGFTSLPHDGEVLSVTGELLCEAVEESDDGGVSLRIHRLRFKVSFLELLDLVGAESLRNELVGDLVEFLLGGSALKDLAGLEEGKDAEADFDRDGGGSDRPSNRRRLTQSPAARRQ